MTNIFWYISLAIIGISSAAYTIYKKRDTYKISTLFVYYLFTASFTWIGEFIVLGLLNAYGYKTGVYTNIWAQNLLGHLLVNTTIYPAAAIIMVAYSLRYGWILSVAAVFTLIEYLFVNLGIYEQHWWRYYMTVIAVIGFLFTYLKWFHKMNQKPYGLTRSITFFFVAMIIIHTPAPLLLLLGKQYYQIGFINDFLGDLYLSSIIIIFFYHLIEAFILVLVTQKSKKSYWLLLPIVTSITMQSLAVKMNILVIDDSWNFGYTLVIYEIFIAAFILIEKYTLKPGMSEPKG